MARTLAALCERDAITAEAEEVGCPGDCDRRRGEHPDPGHRHFRVTLTRTDGADTRTMETPYSMGSGLTDDPDAPGVLGSLLLDASGYENAGGSFEEWAGEYGYDTDSRTAERIFLQVGSLTAKVRALLGTSWREYLRAAERE